VSDVNQRLYDTFCSPLVRSVANEPAARALRMLNPARAERWLFSDLNPWMHWVKSAADTVRASRRPASPENAFVKLEGEASDQIERSLDGYRDARDQSSERLFKGIYESPWLAAWVGLDEKPSAHRSRQSQSWEHQELQRLKREAAEAHIAQGTPLDAW